MTTIMIRRSAFQNLTDKQERLIRIVSDIRLGDPAEYVAPPNTHWFIWDDSRIDFRDVVAFGVFTRLRNQVEAAITEDLDVQTSLRSWLETRLDLSDPPEMEENPLQWALDNNNAPPGIRAGYGPPSDWVPFNA